MITYYIYSTDPTDPTDHTNPTINPTTSTPVHPHPANLISPADLISLISSITPDDIDPDDYDLYDVGFEDGFVTAKQRILSLLELAEGTNTTNASNNTSINNSNTQKYK